MKKRLLLLLVCLTLLSILAVPTAAKTTRTEYEGEEDCGQMMGGRQWISEDGVYHVRDAQSHCTDDTDDPRMSGDALITVNANFQFSDTGVYGPMWGTVRVSNEGGYWEGTWTGKVTELEGSTYIRSVVFGHEDYEGLQARATLVRESPEVTYQIHGVIMDPGGH
jgi:hypothetical protein